MEILIEVCAAIDAEAMGHKDIGVYAVCISSAKDNS